MIGEESPPLPRFERAANELRQREFARLADAVVPRIEALRSVTPAAFRTEIALMLERLGYTTIAELGPRDLIVTKEGRKLIVACARPAELEPTQSPELARLHDAIIAESADAGFYVTTRAFTPAAEHYATTAPIRLVNGEQLAASMKRSREDKALPATYTAMCRQCGDVVHHRLDRADALPCRNGHMVAPTISRAALLPPQQKEAPAANAAGRQPKWQKKNLRAASPRSKAKAHNKKRHARALREQAKAGKDPGDAEPHP